MKMRMRNVRSAGEGVVVKRRSRMMRKKRTRTKSAKGDEEGAGEKSVRKKRKMMTTTKMKSAKSDEEGAGESSARKRTTTKRKMTRIVKGVAGDGGRSVRKKRKMMTTTKMKSAKSDEEG